MPGSPFHIEDPKSVHGVQLKRRFGHPLKPQDMVPIIEANPDLVPNDQFRALLFDVLNGETGPQKGRPERKPGYNGLLVWAEIKIEKRAKEIKEERRARSA
ncbi:MAG: hypothetical protein ACRCY3_12090 [Sphingorhabdus sp.]